MAKRNRVPKKPNERKSNPDIVEAVTSVIAEELAPMVERMDALGEEVKRMKDAEVVDITDEELVEMGIDPKSDSADENLQKFMDDADQQAIELVEELLGEKGADLSAVEVIEQVDMAEAIEEAKAMRRKRNRKSKTNDPMLPEELAEAVAEMAGDVIDESLESPTDFDETEVKSDGAESDEEDPESESETEQKSSRSINRFGRKTSRKSVSKGGYKPINFNRFAGYNGGIRKGSSSRNAFDSLSQEEKDMAIKSYTVDRFIRGNGSADSAVRSLKAANNNDHVKNTSKIQRLEPVYKSLNASTHSQGGALIPEAYSQEIIKYIYAETALQNLLVTKLPFANGNLTVPRNLGGGQAYFVGEGRPAKTQNSEYGNIRLSAKKLVAQASSTEELMMFSDFNVDSLMFDDLMANMGIGVERGVFFGSGSDFAPLGLFNNTLINRIDMAALALVHPELFDASGYPNGDFLTYSYKTLLKQRVSRKNALAWLMNYDVWATLYNQKTPGSGEYIHRAQMDKGLLYGLPFYISEIDEFQSVGKKGKLVLGDWSDLYVAEHTSISAKTSREAAFRDDTGNLVSAFDNDMIVSKATYLFDSAVAREQSFIIIPDFKIA